MEHHYGAGSRTCPTAGKLVPELIAGELERTCEEIWNIAEAELYQVPVHGESPLTNEEWAVVINDFRAGKVVTLTYLQVKTDFLQRLPVLFCALAHTDEEVARAYARKIKDSWLADTRHQAHHRLVWS